MKLNYTLLWRFMDTAANIDNRKKEGVTKQQLIDINREEWKWNEPFGRILREVTTVYSQMGLCGPLTHKLKVHLIMLTCQILCQLVR